MITHRTFTGLGTPEDSLVRISVMVSQSVNVRIAAEGCCFFGEILCRLPFLGI